MNCYSFLQEHFLYYLQKYLSSAGVPTVISNPPELLDGEESVTIEVSQYVYLLSYDHFVCYFCVCAHALALFSFFFFSLTVAVRQCG